MVRDIIKLWNNSELGRSKFFQYMVWLRLSFDICGNITHATIWSFAFYLIYAMLQLFLVRARVRGFNGNVKNWTSFYGSGLVWGGVCILMDIIAAEPLYHLIDSVFNALMLVPIFYLCTYNGGDSFRLPTASQKLQSEQVPVRITKN